VDRELVLRAMGGDHDAFTRIARTTIDGQYAVARLILHDGDRAQDAIQEAYVAAWRDLSSLRDPDRFEAWLRRLVVRAAYREAKRERRVRTVDISVIPLADARDDGPRDVADRDALDRAFARLEPESRTVLVLHHYLGLSLPEVADAMGVPLGTAKSRLHRATEAMRAALEADARSPLIRVGRPA
jgi:RNA polymerase sigma-70 factor, ECF subfamily